MAKPEWGRKILCTGCGVKFYDLNRSPAECPKCGAKNDPLQTFRPKRGGGAKAAAPKVEKAPAPKPEKTADLPEEEDLLEDDSNEDEDDSIIEDTTDLGGDDDDMSEVKEHIETGDGGD